MSEIEEKLRRENAWLESQLEVARQDHKRLEEKMERFSKRKTTLYVAANEAIAALRRIWHGSHPSKRAEIEADISRISKMMEPTE